jgi:hypothetical protein
MFSASNDNTEPFVTSHPVTVTMPSGELLKYRKGLCIAGRYGTHLSGSSQFGLTLPVLPHLNVRL